MTIPTVCIFFSVLRDYVNLLILNLTAFTSRCHLEDYVTGIVKQEA